MRPKVGIRWTIGDVNPAGFEALRLSVFGAMRLFDRTTKYRVYVNTISIAEAQKRVGEVPDALQWCATEPRVPSNLRPYVSDGMAEGVAWKLMPLRAFPRHFELSLDNDVILWGIPPAVEQWLASDDPATTLIAADVAAGFGKFSDLCGPEPRNSGIRGLGPAMNFEAALEHVLSIRSVCLEAELDEQGLQVAALERSGKPFVVDTADVTICSPFYPHSPELGRFGAHFVGLNTRVLPWRYYGKPATQVRIAHWLSLRKELYQRVGLAPRAEEVT